MSEAWKDQPRSSSGQFGRKHNAKADIPDAPEVDLGTPSGPLPQSTQNTDSDHEERLAAITAAPNREAMVKDGIEAAQNGDRREVASMVMSWSAKCINDGAEASEHLPRAATPDSNKAERQAADDLAEVLLYGSCDENLADLWMPEQFVRNRWKPLEHPRYLCWVKPDALDDLKADIKHFPGDYRGGVHPTDVSVAMKGLERAAKLRSQPPPSVTAMFFQDGLVKSLTGRIGPARNLESHLRAAIACSNLFAAELDLYARLETLAPARSAPSARLHPEQRKCGYCEGCYECSGSLPLANEAALLMDNTAMRARHHCLAASRSYFESDWCWS